ncbi:MAG: hypothetical protein IJS54_05580 [Desulfovibrio sp.]|nr:hypothetical protein [Desulfovibrio sp.]
MSQNTEAMQTPHDKAKDMVQIIAELTELPVENVQEMYDKVSKGATLAEIFHVRSESLEAGYALACALLSAGKPKDAVHLFTSVCDLDQNNAKYWLGLGCCYEKMGELRKASLCLANAADLENCQNPKPMYLLAQCCIALDEKETALNVLRATMKAGNENNPTHMWYRTRAQEMVNTLSKK